LDVVRTQVELEAYVQQLLRYEPWQRVVAEADIFVEAENWLLQVYQLLRQLQVNNLF
jgi:hypothetical protein